MTRLGVAVVLTCLVGAGLLGLSPAADGHMKTGGDTTRYGEAFVDEFDTISIGQDSFTHASPLRMVVTVVAMSGETVVLEYDGPPYDGVAVLSLGKETLNEQNLPQGWSRVGTLRGAVAQGTFWVHVEAVPSYQSSTNDCNGLTLNDGITLTVDDRTHNMEACTLSPRTSTQIANIWHCESFVEPRRSFLDSFEFEPCESPEHMAATSVRDTDGDLVADHHEFLDGSSPVFAHSTPLTDDDGDGTWNVEESRPPEGTFARSSCSGSQGIVVGSVCEGYQRPYYPSKGECDPSGGCDLSDEEEAAELGAPYVDSDGRLWLWDSICVPGAAGDYESCKGEASNYDANVTLYIGDWLADGYGWRHVADVPPDLPEEHVDYVGACDQASSDGDGDGLPVFYVCQRRLTVYSDGSTDDVETGETDDVGDPDDADPNNPVDFGAILQEAEQVAELVEDPDEDGYSTSLEALSSNPLDGGSRPDTDDDGDGEINQDEVYFGLPAGVVCAGAYGVVIAPTCGGYESPYGNPSSVEEIAVNQAGGVYLDGEDIWVWDSYCEYGTVRYTDRYYDCKGDLQGDVHQEGSSNYDGSSELYESDFRFDGYGWRFMGQTGTVLPQEFDYVGTCDTATEDNDADDIPVVRLCNRHVVVQPDGSFTDEEESVEEEVGDPDDQDPENPVAEEALLGLVEDTDNDGSNSESEAQLGSHPLQSTSRPSTDDDGDGCSNGEEPGGSLETSMYTGAYGLVAFSHEFMCGGYELPAGCSVVDLVCVDAQDRVWVWDMYCEYGVIGNYEGCKGDVAGDISAAGSSNYDASDEAYGGDFLFDGYGWRRVSDVPVLLPETVDYVGLCDVSEMDADGDGVPVARVCNRHLTINPDGSTEDEETSHEGDVGDPDDGDPNTPVPRDELDELQGFAVAFANQQANETTAFVNTTIGSVTQMVQELQDLVFDTVGDINNDTLQSLQNALNLTEAAIEDAVEATTQFVNETQENSIGAASCSQDRTGEHAGVVLQRTQQFLGDPTIASYEAWRRAVTDRTQQYGGQVATCMEPVLGPGATELVTTLVGIGTRSASEITNQTSDINETLRLITERFGETGEAIVSIFDDTVAVIQSIATSTVGFAEFLQDFTFSAVEALDQDPAVQAARDLVTDRSESAGSGGSDDVQTADDESDGKGNLGSIRIGINVLLILGAVTLIFVATRRR